MKSIWRIRITCWYDDDPEEEVMIAHSPRGVANAISRIKNWGRWNPPRQHWQTPYVKSPSWRTTSGYQSQWDNWWDPQTLRIERIDFEEDGFVVL
jgi:hypothetical protein